MGPSFCISNILPGLALQSGLVTELISFFSSFDLEFLPHSDKVRTSFVLCMFLSRNLDFKAWSKGCVVPNYQTLGLICYVTWISVCFLRLDSWQSLSFCQGNLFSFFSRIHKLQLLDQSITMGTRLYSHVTIYFRIPHWFPIILRTKPKLLTTAN